MKKIYSLFTKHPRSVGETYIEHFVVATRLSFKLSIASMMQLMHAFFPFVAPPLGSDVFTLRKDLEAFDPEFRRLDHTVDSIAGTD